MHVIFFDKSHSILHPDDGGQVDGALEKTDDHEDAAHLIFRREMRLDLFPNFEPGERYY